jgi:hypothetical protein
LLKAKDRSKTLQKKEGMQAPLEGKSNDRRQHRSEDRMRVRKKDRKQGQQGKWREMVGTFMVEDFMMLLEVKAVSLPNLLILLAQYK